LIVYSATASSDNPKQFLNQTIEQAITSSLVGIQGAIIGNLKLADSKSKTKLLFKIKIQLSTIIMPESYSKNFQLSKEKQLQNRAFMLGLKSYAFSGIGVNCFKIWCDGQG
jgi:hypothetical protein